MIMDQRTTLELSVPCRQCQAPKGEPCAPNPRRKKLHCQPRRNYAQIFMAKRGRPNA